MSEFPAYLYQHYLEAQCSKCRKRLTYWCGEYPNGTLTDLYPISAEKRKAWKTRLKPGKPKPKIQMNSDYSQLIKGPIEKQIEYLQKLDRAYKITAV